MPPVLSSAAAAARAVGLAIRRLVNDDRLGARPWIDRAVVLALAGATGLLVVGFALLAEAATDAYLACLSASPLLACAWTPLATMEIGRAHV